jgi:Secretion system C-terminal sorting domain
MKRFIVTAAFALAALATVSMASPPPQLVIGPGLASPPRTPYCQLFNRTLSADTVYVLTGLYYIQPGYSLTIQPGTLILGDKNTSGTIIVTRGAQIHATGTKYKPIVFTSSQAPGNRAPGDWGGIVLLGSAPVNKVEPVIEGGLVGGDCTGTVGTYGGSDPLDSSGEFQYCRIEFAGYRFQQDNEINGLTFGGVGNGTKVDHVQVSYSNDDSYEWFGGTIKCKYLVAFGTTDDEFDTDFGFRGGVQFGFALMDPDIYDPTGQSNGFESDNDGSSTSTDTPYTKATMCNMTLVGPERDNAEVPYPLGSTVEYEFVLRRSTQESVFNSVTMGWPWGVSVRDATTIGWATGAGDSLRVRNCSVQATLKPSGSASVHDEVRWAGVTTWFNTAAWNNIGSAPRMPDTIMLTDMSNLNAPDPRPAAGSELIGSADFSDPRVAGLTHTTYRGAFDPNLPLNEQWTYLWTNFDPQNTDYSMGITTAVNDGPRLDSFLSQNYPNPFNPQTAIDYVVPAAGHVTLEVYNATGARVAMLVDAQKDAGKYTAHFEGTGLSSGVYFYTLKGPGVNETRKMVLLK